MLSVIYAECHKFAFYAVCHYAECHYAECHCAECHYVECRCAHRIGLIMELRVLDVYAGTNSLKLL